MGVTGGFLSSNPSWAIISQTPVPEKDVRAQAYGDSGTTDFLSSTEKSPTYAAVAFEKSSLCRHQVRQTQLPQSFRTAATASSTSGIGDATCSGKVDCAPKTHKMGPWPQGETRPRNPLCRAESLSGIACQRKKGRMIVKKTDVANTQKKNTQKPFSP